MILVLNSTCGISNESTYKSAPFALRVLAKILNQVPIGHELANQERFLEIQTCSIEWENVWVLQRRPNIELFMKIINQLLWEVKITMQREGGRSTSPPGKPRSSTTSPPPWPHATSLSSPPRSHLIQVSAFRSQPRIC